MSSVTKFLSIFILALFVTELAASTENILRDAVIKNGFKHPNSINPKLNLN